MKPRSILIASLLLAIAIFTVLAVLQGNGDYLLGTLAGVLAFAGFWALFGLLLMMRWTISMQFWAGLGAWLRNLRR